MGRKPDIFDTLENAVGVMRDLAVFTGIVWLCCGPWVALAFNAWLSRDWVLALAGPSAVFLFIPCIAPIAWLYTAYEKAKANYRSHK